MVSGLTVHTSGTRLGDMMTDQMTQEAREWLIDIAPENEHDYVNEATPDEVMKLVDINYEGGWAAFIEDAGLE